MLCILTAYCSSVMNYTSVIVKELVDQVVEQSVKLLQLAASLNYLRVALVCTA